MDMLLEDLGLDLQAKLAVLKQARTVFGKEFRLEGQLAHQLSGKYRRERAAIDSLLDPLRGEESPLAPGMALLWTRSARMVPLVQQLRDRQAEGQLYATIPELAQSYLHMHANRMLRAAARAQELVIYDFLTRTYESRLVRARKSEAGAAKSTAEG
jgi:thiopeptide-type bacteriocin biosynthesis protein